MTDIKVKPFIMKDTPQCETALRHWLNERPSFNSYSFSDRGISLTRVNDPDSDWAKVKAYSGRIVCIGVDDGVAAFRRAEEVIRKHLGWPKQEAA
jgi:hypothetical protein